MISGSNEFIAIIDANNFSWSKCPPLAISKQIINSLKYNYPLRLTNIIVVNIGSVSHLIWKMIKPLLPKKAISKLQVANRKTSSKILKELIGSEALEVVYGGDLITPNFHNNLVLDAYFNAGFWEVRNKR